jgi:hypothetical protein
MSGPYRFVGIRDAETIGQLIDDTDSMQVKPGEGACIGSCDHCGTAISVAVLIRGADGVFKVGETCAKKVAEQEPKVIAQVKTACNARRSDLKKAKINKAYDKYLLMLLDGTCLDQPHPKGWEGQTLNDYLGWYGKNAGRAKFVEVCRQHLG